MWLEAINPTVKAATVMVVAIALGATRSIMLNVVIAAVALGWLVLGSHVTSWCIVRFLIPVTWVAFGMYMTGRLFGDGGAHAPDTGTMLATRVIAFAAMGGMFSLTTDPQTFVRSLQQQAKLPQKFAFGVLSTLHLMPRVSDQYAECRRAMAVRGLRTHPFSPTPLRNMLINTVRWSEYLSTAMTSRGFDPDASRATRHVVRVTWRDGVFAAIWAGVFVTALALF